jgi:hypothetical protein
MPTGNPIHLLKLADREFKALTEGRSAPQAARKFNPIKLNVSLFDQAGDRKRGAAARLTAERSASGFPLNSAEVAPYTSLDEFPDFYVQLGLIGASNQHM